MKSEISRVRNLPNGKGWTKNERPKGEIWEQDPISVLPRFGPVLMRKMKEMGVSKVIDIMTMDDNALQHCPAVMCIAFSNMYEEADADWWVDLKLTGIDDVIDLSP